MTSRVFPSRQICPTLLLLLTLVFVSSGFAQDLPVRGVSLAHLHRRGAGYGSDDCRAQLQAIARLGANWVSITDFAYMPDVARPGLRFGGDRSMTSGDLVQVIKDAHAANIKVLIKPHIWSNDFWNGKKWHGDIRMASEEDWKAFFASYTEYVLIHAKLAQETKADALCIGLEYEGTLDREAEWRQLIAEVRKVYTGKLTYAASFIEWKKIPFWDALDCIGINAYFPVASGDRATEAELRAGWTKVFDEIEPFAARLGKQVCLTELGYTESVSAGREPWSSRIDELDPEYQALLYRVAIEEASRRPWVVGIFVWKWFTSDQWKQMERQDPFAIQDAELTRSAIQQAWKKR